MADFEPSIATTPPQTDISPIKIKTPENPSLKPQTIENVFSPNNQQLPPEDIRQMYQIWGQPEITLHSFETYRVNKLAYQAKIEKAAKNSIIFAMSKAIAAEKTRNAYNPNQSEKPIQPTQETTPENQKQSVIEHLIQGPYESLLRFTEKNKDLLNSDRQLQKILFKRILGETNGNQKRPIDSIEMSEYLSNRQQRKVKKKVIRQNLDQLLNQDQDTKIDIGYILFKSGEDAYYKERRKINNIVNIGLSSSNPEMINIAGELTSFLPENLQKKQSQRLVSIIENGINQDDQQIQLAVVDIIRFAPMDQRSRLIKMGFNRLEDQNCQFTLAFTIRDIPNDQISDDVLSIALQSKYQEVQNIAFDEIYKTPQDEQKNLILTASKSQFIEMYKKAIDRIPLLDPDQQLEAIRYGINQKNPEFINQALQKIDYLPREVIADFYRAGLSNPNPDIQFIYSKNLSKIPSEFIPEFIKMGIDSPNTNIKLALLKLIYRVENNQKQQLFELIIKSNLGNLLVSSQLYQNYRVSNSEIKREKFQKTGSEMILIGGSMKEKAVIRRKISSQSFLNWQNLYENHQLWKNNGFDYVPIEQIISYRFDKKSQTVDVVSGVLDTNLAYWEMTSNLFNTELNEKRRKIIDILEKNNILHSGNNQEKEEDGFRGHDHKQNFCLRFFRDQNGQPDFTKEPRLYLIDFDQSSSTSS